METVSEKTGTEVYLRPGRWTDSDSPSIIDAAERITAGMDGDRDRAIALHEFVRDEIIFGFVSGFDEVRASYVLRGKLGHCNPKTALFTSLLRATGIPARIHFVEIPRPVMLHMLDEKIYASSDQGFTHSFVEVYLDAVWVACDNYIIDRPLRDAAVRLCQADGLEMGYGVHSRGVSDWDGRSPAFAQFDLSRPIPTERDLGIVADSSEHYQSDQYIGRMSFIDRIMYELFRGAMNRKIERIRSDLSPEG